MTTHPTAIDEDCTSTSDVPLGLTFSFPVEQKALGCGTILTWTKGFSATNAVGHDVVKLLQDAFDRKHVHVKCVALVNDASSTFLYNNVVLIFLYSRLSGPSYLVLIQQEAALPVLFLGRELIVPTLKTWVPYHLSYAFLSSLYIFTAKIPKLAGSPAAARGGKMVINCEWGGFNNSVSFAPCLYTCYLNPQTAYTSSYYAIR